ncbi:fasciclin domain-containing protein [Mucilaginibacter terrae]|uniref:Surface protein with fasciclin (FAS1) repeats n=1 Tax=Mucilaginibacter terrae TaxID=1955052 RepID=A0ABU3GQS0_9SPHI|nr:fasciclin domain-containing protein [Mucilaginibacter terrae]MDT3402129.1 putative surface protein with fasciclin (FAS1) repeats [Mucilaginibacter terrae]
MRRILQSAFLFLLGLLLITGCAKKEFNERYERPDNLADPIYQQLEQRGNFKSLLTCIEKAGYKDILGKAGFWTMFAPNDAAFAAYFKEKGINSAADIDAATAQKIVKYCLVFNAFKTDRLPDYQSLTGWVPNMAFKRRTAYYDGAQVVNYNGKDITYVNSNRNNRGGTTYFTVSDNNNKYIPYILDRFLTPKNLTPADYNYFNTANPYTGFNVADAQVVNSNIIAENGVIHEVNRVLLPLPSIDQYMGTNNQYSVFKSLFDKYMVSYILSPEATAKNLENTGVQKDIYVKLYDAGLAYSPNNENYQKLDDNDGQAEGYSMFAPTNTALNDYINNVLLEYYPSLDALPKEIMYDFLNAHMFLTTVWPSKFATTINGQGQGALFNPASDVVDKKLLSNGVFYGTNKVQNANVFSTVFGRAYLNPNYSLMTRALTANLKANIINTSLKYTLFLTSDATMRALGFNYDLDANTWRYTPPGGGTALSGSSALDKLNRIINTQVVRADVTSLQGSGILETYDGEYIRYSNNTVYSAGTRDANLTINATSSRTTQNGTVYYIDGLLSEPSLSVGKHLEALSAQANSPYKKFVDYVKASTIYNTSNGEILGVTAGSFYTVLAPTNTAIDAAIAQGYLPATTAPTDQIGRDKVANFIRYHIIQKATVVPDGKKAGGFLTLLQTANGTTTAVNVTNTGVNNMQVRDMLGNTVNVVAASSNNLSNRTVIHLLDNFLKFNAN